MRPSDIRQWVFDTRDANRPDFWSKRVLLASQILAVTYCAITIGALILFALCGPAEVKKLAPGYSRLIAVLVGVFASAAPPVWLWYEARAYDDWLNNKHPGDSVKQAPYRETLKIHTEHARAFWAGILAAYAAVLMTW